MSLASEILENYLDADGLVTLSPGLQDHENASGNGVMYLCEFVVLLALRKELTSTLTLQCLFDLHYSLKGPGLLTRGMHNYDQEAIDDVYAYLAGVTVSDNADPITYAMSNLALQMVRYGINHLGYFDNTRPYVAKPFNSLKSLIAYIIDTVKHWNGDAFHWRQPQLLCATFTAAGLSPWWIYPFRVYTALVIATSCMFAKPTDTDARRLSWLLIQTMKPRSWICRQAAKLWYNKLYKTYGPKGMQVVREMYYGKEHPFTKYSVD